MKRGVRGLAFVVAVLAHIALIALLVSSARQRVSESPEAPRMTLVFLEPEARDSERRSAQPTQSLRLSAPAVPLELPHLDPSTAITVPTEPPAEESPTAPSVDWQQETRTAAARMAESLDAERRRKPATDPRFARPTPGPEFGWDKSKTHRIESLPQGGTVIHLNDRCALVLSALLLPVCKLGKIPARGDLFEHMGDGHDDEGYISQ